MGHDVTGRFMQLAGLLLSTGGCYNKLFLYETQLKVKSHEVLSSIASTVAAQ